MRCCCYCSRWTRPALWQQTSFGVHLPDVTQMRQLLGGDKQTSCTHLCDPRKRRVRRLPPARSAMHGAVSF